MRTGGPILSVLRHDSWVMLGGLVLVVLVAAVYTVTGTGMTMSAMEMTRMAGPLDQSMEMGFASVWYPVHGALIFAMWWLMMIAKWVPSAAPTLLLHHSLTCVTGRTGVQRMTWAFLAGYFAIWALFSALATGLQ